MPVTCVTAALGRQKQEESPGHANLGYTVKLLSRKKKNEDERMIERKSERKEKYCMLYMYVVIIPS